MELKNFIAKYRDTIDKFVLRLRPNAKRITNREREQVVVTDPQLRLLAQLEGVVLD